MAVYLSFWILTVLGALAVRKRMAVFLFYFLIFLFVGLRYETGFDWPVYKEIFGFFEGGTSFERISLAYLFYAQEIGFLAVLSILAQIFPSYEYAQAIFSLVFLASVYRLSSVVPGAKPALVIALYLCFLLLPVGFSTVRQSSALALFNFALASYLTDKNGRAIVFVVISVLLHTSAILYVFAALLARLLVNRDAIPSARLFFLVSISSFISIPILLNVGASIIPAVASRVALYRELDSLSILDPTAIIFSLLATGIGLHASRVGGSAPNESEATKYIRALIVIMATLAIASFFSGTLRDRIFYALILFYCVYISRNGASLRRVAIFTVVVLGILYQVVFFLGYPGRLAFYPYQNGVVLKILNQESDGQERSNLFLEEFEWMFR